MDLFTTIVQQQGPVSSAKLAELTGAEELFISIITIALKSTLLNAPSEDIKVNFRERFR